MRIAGHLPWTDVPVTSSLALLARFSSMQLNMEAVKTKVEMHRKWL